MSSNHEIQICKAIAHMLGTIMNEEFVLAYRPDEIDRSEKAIDAVFKGAGVDLAMEHTLIESFHEQIQDGQNFAKFTQPLEEKLKGIFPLPGCYTVVIEPLALKGIKKTDEVRNSLYSWIVQRAPQLELRSPKTALKHFVKEQPPGVPFEVILSRWPGRDGQIRFVRSIPDTLKTKTEEPIRRALSDKCPKLSRAKEDGVITVLVLELDDIALGETIEVSRSIVAHLRDSRHTMDLPDKVYLMRTETLEEWEITAIKEGDLSFPQICGYGSYFFDTELLNDPGS